MHLSFVSPDSTLQTPDSVERRKLAIVQEVLYGHDKVSRRKQPTFDDATTQVSPQNDVWAMTAEFHTSDMLLPRSG